MVNQNPSAPNTKWLEGQVEQLDADIQATTDADGVIITKQEAKQILDTMVWTLNMLNGRKVYQKKQQVKRKIINTLIKKHLDAAELAKIEADAKAEAAASVLTTVEVDGDDASDSD